MIVKKGCTTPGNELRYAKEDILRFLRECGGSAAVDEVIKDIEDEELVKEGIKELEREGLINKEGRKLVLTKDGQSRAEEVYRVHKKAEELFKDVVANPHLAAHSIEHLNLDLEFLSSLRRGGIKRLTEMCVGRVVAILNPRPSIISRVFGVGAVIGRVIRVIAKSYGLIVIEAGYEKRTAAIDVEVAKSILVVPVTPEGVSET